MKYLCKPCSIWWVASLLTATFIRIASDLPQLQPTHLWVPCPCQPNPRPLTCLRNHNWSALIMRHGFCSSHWITPKIKTHNYLCFLQCHLIKKMKHLLFFAFILQGLTFLLCSLSCRPSFLSLSFSFHSFCCFIFYLSVFLSHSIFPKFFFSPSPLFFFSPFFLFYSFSHSDSLNLLLTVHISSLPSFSFSLLNNSSFSSIYSSLSLLLSLFYLTSSNNSFLFLSSLTLSFFPFLFLFYLFVLFFFNFPVFFCDVSLFSSLSFYLLSSSFSLHSFFFLN